MVLKITRGRIRLHFMEKSLWKKRTTKLLIRKAKIFLNGASPMCLRVDKGKGHPTTRNENQEG